MTDEHERTPSRHDEGVIDRDRDPQEFARVLGLSDSIFGVAMTLLVISIVLPAGLSSEEFSEALGSLVRRFAIMALSIGVAASAWITHHRLFATIQRVDSGLMMLNIVLIGLVAFIPFPHQVLGEYPFEPLAYVLYAAVLASVNAMAVVMDVYVRRQRLQRTLPPESAYRRELARGLLVVTGFAVSIPLAFVLVAWTPVIWVVLLPLDRILVATWR